jgi:RsiW-degrading membrane proteinase PrsW (M82 family)
MSATRKHGKAAVLVFIIAVIGVIALLTASSSVGLLFVVAVAPSVFLLWYFYHADKYKHESKKLLGVTFLIGALSTVPAMFIEGAYSEPALGAGIFAVFVYYLFGVGLVEEFMKFLSVRVYAYRSKHFDEPMDGIVFGVAAALGFATIENILYVLLNGLGTGVIRAIVSVPGHTFWGAIMRFYLGKAKMRGRPRLVIYGLAIVVFLHGLYDTVNAILPGWVALVAMLAIVWIVYFKVVKKEIAEAEAESPYEAKPPNSPPTQPRTTLGPLRFCTQCGNAVQAGTKFCVSCGHRVT